MEVDEGLVQARVAEVGADVAEIDALVQEVGGVAVTKGVRGDALFEMERDDGKFEGVLNGGGAHGSGGFIHGEALSFFLGHGLAA